MVSSHSYHNKLGGHGATMGIIGNGVEIQLNALRLRGIGISPSRALDMSRNPLLTISYLLRDEYKRFEV